MAFTQQETSKTAQAGKLKMHYNEAGQGEPLICIHGGGPGASGWSNYSRNIDELAKHFRTVLIDLPGFGKTDKPKIEGGFMAFMATAVRDLMDTLGIQRANFIGNSLGGGTTLKFAMDFPDRANRLVLMGAGGGIPMFTPMPTEGIKHLMNFYEPPGPSIEKLKAFINVMVYDSSKLTDELLKERYAAATQPDVIANTPLRRSTMAQIEPLWKDLGKVRNKTLIIWGRDDRTVPLDSGLIMLSQMPDVQFHVFSKCGHWAQWEKAYEFNRLVITYLTGTE